MRRTTLILGLTLALTVGLLAGPTFAAAGPGGPNHDHDTPLHAHMLLIHPEVGIVEGTPMLVGFRRCVDLAANQPVPNHAHHANLHLPTGSASQALSKAGLAVVPAFAWADCAALEAAMPFPVGPPPS